MGDWHKIVVAALKEFPAWWRKRLKSNGIQVQISVLTYVLKTSFIFSKFRPQSLKLSFHFFPIDELSSSLTEHF